MARTSSSEIRALAGIVDEVDYYQLLDVPRDASGTMLKAAYHRAARRFHPDAQRQMDATLREATERIAKRVSEGYAVLRDPRRRRLYDERLKRSPEQNRLQLVEAENEADRRSASEAHGRTPGGRRYFAMARAELQRGHVAAVERHLQMALTFEPDNEFFKELHEKLRLRA